MRLTALLLSLALLGGVALAADPEVVSFKTDDRLKIEGDFWKCGRKGAPAVIALHADGSTRAAFRPVAHLFWNSGIDFLAIDLRGYGGSAKQKRKDLSEKVKERDEKHFRAMWKDAAAVVAFLEERGSDVGRVLLVGEGLGAAVAIDAASRDPRILGTVLVSPDRSFPGIDTTKHLETYGNRPTLILATKEAEALREAIGKGAEHTVAEKSPKIDKKAADWVADVLGAGLFLDGEVTKSEEPRILFGDWDMMENGKGRPVYTAKARWIYAGIRLTGGTSAPEAFYFAWARDGDPDRARRLACIFTRKGATFTLEALHGRKWKPVKGAIPKGVRLGISSSRAVEVIIPRRFEGLAGEGALNIAFGLALKKGNHLSALPLGDNDLTGVRKWLDHYLPE